MATLLQVQVLWHCQNQNLTSGRVWAHVSHQEFSQPLKVLCGSLYPLRLSHKMDFSGAGDRGFVPSLSLNLPLELLWNLPCICLIKFCVVS